MKTAIAAIVVVLIIIVAVIVIAMMSAYQYDATVYIHVTSEHISNTVEIDLYIDGEHEVTDSLPALYEITYTYELQFSTDPYTLTISGTGSGGGLGDTYDYAVLTVEDGGVYNVYLTL